MPLDPLKPDFSSQLIHPETLHEAASRAESSPNYALWLIYLYFKPRLFFKHFVQDHFAVLTALVAWMFGVTSAADRLESAISRNPIPQLSGSWAAFLGAAAVVGVFAAAVYYTLGGWWYRVRLVWSGVADPDPKLTRRVYIYASTVYTLPACMHLLWLSMNYARPIDAFNSSSLHPGDWAMLLFPIWSVVTSYIGVRTVFRPVGFRAALWFLILPLLLVCVAFGLIMVGLLLGGSMPTLAPAIGQPLVYRSADVVFEHPGNWGVDTSDPAFSPGANIPISMDANAAFHIEIYESTGTVEQEADGTVGLWREQGDIPEDAVVTEFKRWGRHVGAGREVRFSQDGDQLVYRVFVAEWDEGRRIEAVEAFANKDRDRLSPGFNQVSQSLRRESPPAQ